MSSRLLCSTTLLTLSSLASGQIAFDPATTYSAPTRPDSTTAGDFDGDGDVDLAVSTDNVDKVSIFTNAGDGTYALSANVLTGGGTGPGVSAAGDFDGDGDVDLAVCLKNVNTLRVLTNTNGTFSLGATVTTGLEPRHIAAGDLNGDGALDLVVSNRDSNSLSVLLNQGNATFGAALVSAGGDPRSVALGDLDGDGDLDVAVASQDTRQILLFTNAGGGLASSGVLNVNPNLRPDGLVAADLDGDGDVDLATSTETLMSVFTNSGAGTFTGPTTFPTGGTDSSDTAAADFDLDGDVDLVVVDNDTNTVSLLPNNGAGGFGAATILATGAGADGISVADLDGNGGADFALANTDSDTLGVYLNQMAGQDGPLVYCTPKTSSAGCVSMIGTSDPGAQPTSGAGGYSVVASGVQGQKNGLLFAGITGPAALPFGGGILCVNPPLQRGPIMASGGTNATSCDGSYATIVNDGNQIPGGLDAGAGNSGWYQYWYRDPNNGAGNLGTALTNAVQLDFD